MIIFIYKIMTKEYPNPGFDLSTISINPRTGIKMAPKLNLNAPTWVRTARGSSFFNRAPKLFNILPRELRDPKILAEPNGDEFKKKLDKYLITVPDQPKTEGLFRPALTNSILYQDRYKTAA